MSVLHITNETFESEVLHSTKPVLLDFFADWCGPCKMLSPILEELAAEHPEVTVAKVNVDEEPALAAQFNVMSIPSIFVLKDGAVTAQTVGAQPKAQLLNMLR